MSSPDETAHHGVRAGSSLLRIREGCCNGAPCTAARSLWQPCSTTRLNKSLTRFRHFPEFQSNKFQYMQSENVSKHRNNALARCRTLPVAYNFLPGLQGLGMVRTVEHAYNVKSCFIKFKIVKNFIIRSLLGEVSVKTSKPGKGSGELPGIAACRNAPGSGGVVSCRADRLYLSAPAAQAIAGT